MIPLLGTNRSRLMLAGGAGSLYVAETCCVTAVWTIPHRFLTFTRSLMPRKLFSLTRGRPSLGPWLYLLFTFNAGHMGCRKLGLFWKLLHSTLNAFYMNCGTAMIPKLCLTRAPLGYFYNAPHWGGGSYFEPPSDLRNYRTDSKNSSGIWKPWKNC